MFYILMIIFLIAALFSNGNAYLMVALFATSGIWAIAGAVSTMSMHVNVIAKNYELKQENNEK